jgi:acyl-CoA thioester hydrolase
MYSFETKVRVRYSETDQMGFVYYGVFAQYFEIGRVELLRSLGISYKKLEEEGYFLPVVNFEIHYKKPALYDDELSIKTTIKQLPSVRITFYYETYNTEKILLNTGKVVLVFVDKTTKKPCLPPAIITEKLKEKSES